MQPFAAEFLKVIETQHAEIARLIDGLPQAALDWSPGPDMNSFVVLVTHVVGSERYWAGDVIARGPSNRNRPAEFQTSGVDAAELKARLQTATDYARHVLDGLTLQDLEASRTAPSDGSERTVAWCLAHILEHTGTHVGHIQMNRQFWELQKET